MTRSLSIPTDMPFPFLSIFGYSATDLLSDGPFDTGKSWFVMPWVPTDDSGYWANEVISNETCLDWATVNDITFYGNVLVAYNDGIADNWTTSGFKFYRQGHLIPVRILIRTFVFDLLSETFTLTTDSFLDLGSTDNETTTLNFSASAATEVLISFGFQIPNRL